MALTGTGINGYMLNADGSMSTGSVWSLVDSVSFFEVDSYSSGPTIGQSSTTLVAANTTYISGTGTTWSYSSSPPTIDGIAIKINTNTQVTGTFTLTLTAAGTAVTGGSVTCNLSDIPASGWHFFKFAAPITLVVSTVYNITGSCTVGSAISVLSTSTNVWYRMLRTTSTGTAPQAASAQNDNVIVMGETSGAGVNSTRVLTWNVTSNTYAYNALIFSGMATVNLENNASTNYYMRFKNNSLWFGSATTVNLGTTTSPVPSTSSFTMTMNSTSSQPNVSLYTSGATISLVGQPKTNWTTLTATLNAGATSATLTDVTGWLVGDFVCFTSTTTTYSQAEAKTITAISGNTVTWSGGLTNQHLGVSPKIGHAININRNVTVMGQTYSTGNGNVFFGSGSSVTAHNVAFHNMGYSQNNYYGMQFSSVTGATFDFTGCAIWDSVFGHAFYISSISGGSVNITNCVTWNIGGSSFNNSSVINPGSGTLTVTGCCFAYCTSANNHMVNWNVTSSSYTFTNNVIANMPTNGVAVGLFGLINYGTYGTISGNTTYGTGAPGILWSPAGPSSALLITATIASHTAWCCNYGFYMGNQMLGENLNFNGFTAFSNSTAHISLQNNFIGLGYWNNLQFQAGTSPATPNAILFPSGTTSPFAIQGILIDNSNIGDVQSHSTGDLVFTKNIQVSVSLRNTVLGSSNPVVGVSNFIFGTGIGSDRDGQVDGAYKTWTNTGIISSDTSIYYTNSPSLRGTPNTVGNPLYAVGFSVAVPNGQSPSVSVRVRKSNTSAGDSATYNGSQPYLIMVSNPQAGINSTTTVATCTSASNGAWETLTATIPAVTGDCLVTFQIICDGSTGWINVDDVSTTQETSDQGGMSFARGGEPFIVLGSGTNKTKIVPYIRKRAV